MAEVVIASRNQNVCWTLPAFAQSYGGQAASENTHRSACLLDVIPAIRKAAMIAFGIVLDLLHIVCRCRVFRREDRQTAAN
jgi:hypothetical protein